MSVQQENFKAIADKIRLLSGRTDKIRPSEFGIEIGQMHKAATQKGYQLGAEEQQQAKWLTCINGLHNGWIYGFAGKGVNDETFTPYTNIRINSGYNIIGLFTYCGITDLKGIMERYGVSFDLALGASCQNLFANSKCTRIPRLNLDNGTTLQNAFSGCADLVSIDEIYAPKASSWSNTFQNCTNLEELRITSAIQLNNFDVHWSAKLSHSSLMSIINALADKTTSTSGTQWVCTLGTDNLNKLNETEIAIATGKGWILA